MSFEYRVGLDEALLEPQLVFQTIALAVLRFGGEDAFGAGDRLARFLMTCIEDHFAQCPLNLVRQLSHRVAWWTAVGFEFHRSHCQRSAEVEQGGAAKSCF